MFENEAMRISETDSECSVSPPAREGNKGWASIENAK
jgi:hypothetical protein